MFLLAVVLLVGATMLNRANSKGILLHRVYAGLQILASIGLGERIEWDLYNSPAGMMFYFAAIPGLITSIYPVIVLLALFGVTNKGEPKSVTIPSPPTFQEPASGNTTLKSDPFPISLLTVNCPPCSCTIRFAIANPNPVPLFFVE